jgi:hypothetical protein
MSSNPEKSNAYSVPSQTPDGQKTFSLDDESRLPEKYRQQILQQYELPATKVTMLDILRWATSFEVFLMIVGILLAIAAG